MNQVSGPCSQGDNCTCFGSSSNTKCGCLPGYEIVDMLVCLYALIISIPPSSSYGFISMQISMNVHKAKVCATTVLALTPTDPFFVYAQLVMSLIPKSRDV